MSALVQSLSDFIKVLIEAFNFSSIFPAAVFVILLRMSIVPFLPENSIRNVIESWDGQTQTGIGILLVALLAYLLNAANIRLIRWLEGYPWKDLPVLKKITEGRQNYVEETLNLIQECEDTLIALQGEYEAGKSEEIRRIAGDLLEYQQTLVAGIHDRYPYDKYQILPTGFGNIIAAAETYPHRVLGMDAITLWPFLMPTLTEKNYAQHLARERAIMDFLINLAVVLAFFGIVFGGCKLYCHQLSWELGFQLTLIFLSSWFMYRLAEQGALNWGTMIKTAFVLFRRDLVKALGLRRPSSYEDEIQLWSATSDFLRANPADCIHLKKLGNAIFDTKAFSEMVESKGGKS